MFPAKINPDRKFLIPLAGITIAGLLLRLNGLGSESITADEVSALLRLKFSNFHSMIEGGVRPDGHPAFTQVLLWFWTKWFGWSEFAVRFPFVIFGTASIWLSGLIARKWFSNGAALATAAGIAFLQFTIMYSQLARPYAPGLFFTLLAVYFWTKFVSVRKDPFEKKSPRKRDIAGFAFAAALAAYSHYFSLLTTALIAVAGLFFVAKEIRLRYLLACVLAVILFIPHLSITLSQLEIGGVGGPGGWLGKPTPGFILDHLKFVFDSSRGMMWGVFIVCCISFLFFSKKRKPDRFQLLAFFLWLLPLIIGYAYSVMKNPVLQDSVLLFGFPFLLMFLFSWIPDYNTRKIAGVFPIGFTIIFFGYITIYKPFHLTDHFGRLKELVGTAIDWQNGYGNESTDIFYNVDAPYFLEYNYSHFEAEPKNVLGTINNGNKDLMEFRNMVKNSGKNFFIYGWSTRYSPIEILPIIQEEFPYLVQKQTWFNSGIYLFSKLAGINHLDDNDEIVFHSIDSFNPAEIYSVTVDTVSKVMPQAKWTTGCNVFVEDSATLDEDTSAYVFRWKPHPVPKYLIRLDSACVYSPSLEMKVGDILKNPDNQILFTASVVSPDSNSNIVLVIEFQREGKPLYWNGMESASQIDPMFRNEWQNIYFGLQLPKDLRQTDTVKFYCYSKNGKPMLIDYLDVKTLKGHKGIYGPRVDFR